LSGEARFDGDEMKHALLEMTCDETELPAVFMVMK